MESVHHVLRGNIKIKLERSNPDDANSLDGDSEIGQLVRELTHTTIELPKPELFQHKYAHDSEWLSQAAMTTCPAKLGLCHTSPKFIPAENRYVLN
jgi:hypothetical protein